MNHQITRQRHGWQAIASALRAPASSQNLLSKLFQLRERPPRGQDSGHTLAQLRQARFTLALHGQYPATPACPKPYPDRKPLRCCQSQKGIGLRLDSRHLTAVVMQVGCPVLGLR